MSPLRTITIVLLVVLIVIAFWVVGCWVIDLYEWSKRGRRMR